MNKPATKVASDIVSLAEVGDVASRYILAPIDFSKSLIRHASIAFGRWAPARPSTKRFVFVCLLRLVDGRMRAHRPNASFSGVRSTVCGRFPGGLPPPRLPATMA